MVPGSNVRELLPLLDQRGEEEGAVTRTWKERLCGEHHLTGAAFQLQGIASQTGVFQQRSQGEKQSSYTLLSLIFYRAPLSIVQLELRG